jgi:hypothetical protein
MSKCKYLRVSPPSIKSDKIKDVYVDIEANSIDWLDLYDRLMEGTSFNLEDLEKERIANAKVEDYGSTEEEATEAVHHECTEELVELLNFVLDASGVEVSAESTFQLVDDIAENDDGADEIIDSWEDHWDEPSPA